MMAWFTFILFESGESKRGYERERKWMKERDQERTSILSFLMSVTYLTDTDSKTVVTHWYDVYMTVYSLFSGLLLRTCCGRNRQDSTSWVSNLRPAGRWLVAPTLIWVLWEWHQWSGARFPGAGHWPGLIQETFHNNYGGAHVTLYSRNRITSSYCVWN